MRRCRPAETSAPGCTVSLTIAAADFPIALLHRDDQWPANA